MGIERGWLEVVLSVCVGVYFFCSFWFLGNKECILNSILMTYNFDPELTKSGHDRDRSVCENVQGQPLCYPNEALFEVGEMETIVKECEIAAKSIFADQLRMARATVQQLG